ncbi:MAG TPA: hypothetical protein VLZ50_16430 [Terracidiphilus sp.]|nr:hypothetical protein [Terracidiphilus sp.]
MASLAVDMRGSQAREISGLDRFGSLTSLTLIIDNSDISDLHALASLKNLTSLSLSLAHSQARDFSWIESLDRLATLSLSLDNEGARLLPALKSSPQLKEVQLSLPADAVSSFPDDARLRAITRLSVMLDASYRSATIPGAFDSSRSTCRTLGCVAEGTSRTREMALARNLPPLGGAD